MSEPPLDAASHSLEENKMKNAAVKTARLAIQHRHIELFPYRF